MADDREFEPRLGRIRASGGGRGKSYLQRVLRAASLAGHGSKASKPFLGSRIARGFGAGRVLARRDRYAIFRQRRVIIKTRIVKLRGQGTKAAALHLRYIQRDGVTRDGAPGELYSRDADRTDGNDFLKRAGEDRHQFRFIVSAEDAGEYADLKPFVRKLMARMEADLGTALDWVAVDHHNTGHPHSHIVLRGRDDLGQDLVIAREYIAHGMRERAAEIVTLDLGPRTDLEIEDRLGLQVTQERLTDLDKALRRDASLDGAIALANTQSDIAHQHRAGRLQVLSRLGLADEATPGHWRLSPDMEATLRTMGERADIIKTMNRELAARSVERGVADIAVFGAGAAAGQSVTGRVVARGLSDERAGAHYLVVDGVDGKVHYAEIAEDTDGAVASGAIVRLGAAARAIREVDRTVEAVARQHNGIYSPEHHQAYDATARPEFIAAHVRRLEALRKTARLVERHADGSWTIPPGYAERGATFDQARAQGRVELLSPLPPDQLRTVRARSWLDQELLADAPTPLHGGGFGHEVRKALQDRRAWLVQEGFARQETTRTAYRRDMLSALRDQELAHAGGELAASLGKRYVAATSGHIEGVYRGPAQLVSGKFAIVERSREFTLVPWRPVLEREFGKPVHGIVRGDNVSWTVGRQRGPGIT
jgi:type IV secretory pathway VirD2 relaxase